MLAQRGRVGVEPGGKLDLPPDQLDDAAAAAAEVQHTAVRRDVAAHHRLELVAARFPFWTDGAVPLAICVLDRQR